MFIFLFSGISVWPSLEGALELPQPSLLLRQGLSTSLRLVPTPLSAPGNGNQEFSKFFLFSFFSNFRNFCFSLNEEEKHRAFFLHKVER